MKIIALVLIAAIQMLFASTAFSQDESTGCPKIQPALDSDLLSKDWQKVDLKSFSIFLPSKFRAKTIKCIEGGCKDFESDDSLVRIDINPDAGRPSFERRYPSYAEQFVCVDGARAWRWRFENAGDFHYVSAILIQPILKNPQRIGIYFLSNSKIDDDMVDRMFNSFRFNRK